MSTIKRILQRVAIVGTVALIAPTAPAQTTPARTGSVAASMPDEQPVPLAEILSKLGSDEYAQREAAQRLLDKIPPDQIAQLRTAAVNEKDPEIKSRLYVRIEAMELYVLLHPPAVSVDVKDVTLMSAVTRLNASLGSQMVQSSGWQPITLKADNQPFWEIIKKIDEQCPISMTSGTVISQAGISNMLVLTPSGTAPHDMRIQDAFVILPTATGQRSTASWQLRLTLFTDPRVRVTQYSTFLDLDKLTDQDGQSLLPLVMPPNNPASSSTPTRPVSAWSSGVTMSKSPGVTRLKQLQGTIALRLLETEKVLTFDLTQEDIAPQDSPLGKVTIEKINAGQIVLHIGDATRPGSSPSPGVYTVITFDKDGNSLRNSMTSAQQLNIAPVANGRQAMPAKAIITMSDKTQEMILHVDLKDIDLPPEIVNPPVGVRAGRL